MSALLPDDEYDRVLVAAEGKEVHSPTVGREDVVTVDEILAGAGRDPNVEGLNLEQAGVEKESSAAGSGGHVRYY